MRSCFFFQAEDGIRDADVTGVQTCALPIWRVFTRQRLLEWETAAEAEAGVAKRTPVDAYLNWMPVIAKIGRASCRERGSVSEGGAALTKKKIEWRGAARELQEHA